MPAILRITIAISVIAGFRTVDAEAIDSTRFNSPFFMSLFGIKLGYEFGSDIFLGPEVSLGYVH